MSLNEEIMDLQVRHQVGVQRLGSGVLQKLIPILNTADEEIVTQLVKRGADGTFTTRRLEALLQSIREINRDAHVELGRELRAELREVAAYEARYQADLFSRALPIRADIVTPAASTLNAVVTSRPFQGKLLRDALSELESSRARMVRDAIRLGVLEGQTIPQMVQRLRGTRALRYKDGVMNIGRRQAEALVRTAVSHTTSAAREETYLANSDIIKAESWIATLDSRTCVSCQSLDGQEFELGKGPRTPLHYSCRCVRVPVLKSWQEMGFGKGELPEGTRASMDGQVPASMTYNEWLKKQPAAVQDEALGPTRGKLFREGKVKDVDRFVNRNGDALTLDELRQREGVAA